MKNLIIILVFIIATILGTYLGTYLTFNERKIMQQFQGNDGNMYQVVPKWNGSSWGVDYFRINSGIGDASYQQPITREIFWSQTGSDPTPIEQNVANQPPPAPTSTTGQDTTNTKKTSGGTGGTGGTTLGSTDLYNKYTGQTTRYNLNDPAQKQALYNEKLSILTQDRETALAEGKKTSDRQILEIDNEIKKTYDEAKAYVEDYTKNVNEFGDQYQLGNVKRGQFFAGLSPNAFQSSQGTSQAFAENKYLQGLGDYAKEAMGNVGQQFLAHSKDENAANYLDANSIYGQNVANLQQNRANIGDEYNKFFQSSQQQVGQGAADTSNALSGVGSYNYAANPVAKQSAQKVDTSAYSPYTTFMQAGQQVPVGSGQTMSYSKPQFTPGTPLESFLGQNVISQKGKDYIAAYLRQ